MHLCPDLTPLALSKVGSWGAALFVHENYVNARGTVAFFKIPPMTMIMEQYGSCFYKYWMLSGSLAD